MKLMSKPLAACLFTCFTISLTAIASQFYYKHFRDQQQQQSMLLLELGAGTHQLLVESQSLLQDSGNLAKVQSYQDRNIVNYQHISKGNLKQGLPALDTLISDDLQTLDTSFNQYSALVSSLIQSRTKLDQLSDQREALTLGAKALAEKATGLAQGIAQYGAESNQITASYETALILTHHYLNVYQVFAQGARYTPIDMKFIQENLGSITSGKQASDSAILRRSTMNLLDGINDYAKNSSAITDYEKLENNFIKQMTQLSHAQEQLQQAIAPLADTLHETGSFRFSMSLTAWILAVASALIGVIIATRESPKPNNLLQIQPEPASEVTGSYYLNQIRTDKNKLLNDIRPLADGILYIKADEHYESTGDIARCFNLGREALIQRIETMQQSCVDIEDALINLPASEHRKTEIKFNSSPLEDLTFKAQAELEGIARRVKTLAAENTDNRKLILTQCIRADNILDEIRVRIRKGLLETTQEVDNSKADQDSAYQSKAKNLVSQLAAQLSEFQTQPPTKRNKRAFS